MRLYDEIFKSAEGMGGARYAVALGGGGYFEGVKAVGDLSAERIVLYFPRQSLAIEGEALVVKKYCEGDLEVAGKIHAVYLLGAEKGEHPEKEG